MQVARTARNSVTMSKREDYALELGFSKACTSACPKIYELFPCWPNFTRKQGRLIRAEDGSKVGETFAR